MKSCGVVGLINCVQKRVGNYEIAAVKEQYNLASRRKSKTDCARVLGILRMRKDSTVSDQGRIKIFFPGGDPESKFFSGLPRPPLNFHDTGPDGYVIPF